MVNLLKVGQGAGFFLMGYLAIVMSQWIIPPMIDAAQEFYTSSELEQIVWFFVIILWVLLGVVIPSIYIMLAIKEPLDAPAPLKVVMGGLIFLIGLLLTSKAWYMIDTFTGIAQNTLISAIFWIGFIIVWVEFVLLTPAYLFIEARNS